MCCTAQASDSSASFHHTYTREKEETDKIEQLTEEEEGEMASNNVIPFWSLFPLRTSTPLPRDDVEQAFEKETENQSKTSTEE